MRRQLRRFAPVPLRLMLGGAFLYHGIPKLFEAGGHAAFTAMLQSLDVPAPAAAAWLIGLLECAGGVAFLAGVWTTGFGSLLMVEMLAAAVLVHGPAGFNFLHVIGQTEAGPVYGLPGYEVNLLYIAALGSLLLSGPGPWSAGGRRRTAQEQASGDATQTVIRAEPEGAPLDVDVEEEVDVSRRRP